ncbi:uncharacterized protein LOC135948572 [Cloeon dipterum]|uniref:uncharacterized protein LOC135948572 n=1 Tax=Cloeon dipterum TaxID=197152 RepID=UPI00321F6FF2
MANLSYFVEMEERILKNPLNELCPERLRKIGNDFFMKNEYWKAISCFTKSLARSPAGSRLRGLAYANRSAVLLSLGHYKECLADAQTALANDYPQETAYKLYLRMGLCKKMMGMTTEAEEDFQLSIKMVEDLGIEEEKELKEECLKQFTGKHKPVIPQVYGEYLKPPKLNYGKNPLEPKISSALLKLKDRHALVAKNSIKIGDVLVIEEPLSYGTHFGGGFCVTIWIYCSECFKMCLNLAPCSSCSWACYCSEDCSKTAWEKYHKTECAAMDSVLKKLIEDNDNRLPPIYIFVVQSFMIIAAFGLENCIASYQNEEISENATIMVKEFLKARANVARVSSQLTFELVAESLKLSGERKKSLISFLRTAASKVFWLRGISQVSGRCRSPVALDVSLNPIGIGYYHMLGLIDLSCDPNVCATYYQKTLVLRAQRPIKEGEKLYMSHDIDFNYKPLVNRQQLMLQNLGIQCQCAACIGDWRMLPHQPFCHDQSLQNSSLIKRFMNFDFNSALRAVKPTFPMSNLTIDRYKNCVKIRNHYGEGRRDDHVYKITGDFLQVYFASSAMRFSVSSPRDNVDRSCLVPLVPR